MKKLILFIAIALLSTAAYAQTDCPPDKVCITRSAAVKALEDRDARTALEAENKVLTQAIEDYKSQLNSLKVELAKTNGQLTGAEQMVVRLSALIEILAKSTRKKSIGLIAL